MDEHPLRGPGATTTVEARRGEAHSRRILFSGAPLLGDGPFLRVASLALDPWKRGPTAQPAEHNSIHSRTRLLLRRRRSSMVVEWDTRLILDGGSWRWL